MEAPGLPFANERITRTIREREYFNKIDLLVTKPAGTSTIEGTIHVKGIQLHVATAADVRRRVVDGYQRIFASAAFNLIRLPELPAAPV